MVIKLGRIVHPKNPGEFPQMPCVMGLRGDTANLAKHKDPAKMSGIWRAWGSWNSARITFQSGHLHACKTPGKAFSQDQNHPCHAVHFHDQHLAAGVLCQPDAA
jgi:hypothetical protein